MNLSFPLRWAPVAFCSYVFDGVCHFCEHLPEVGPGSHRRLVSRAMTLQASARVLGPALTAHWKGETAGAYDYCPGEWDPGLQCDVGASLVCSPRERRQLRDQLLHQARCPGPTLLLGPMKMF